MSATITELEELEYRLVDSLFRLPLGEATAALRRRCEDVLAKIRVKKAALLDQFPDILRKSASRPLATAEPRWFGLPAVGAEVDELVKAARDRQAEEQRLAKASGRTRYQAPEHLRGKSIRLVDGRRLDVPAHGTCELSLPSHAHYGPARSAVHGQLVGASFRELPDEPDEALKRTLREQPIVGDRNLIAFLNRRR
jgi:hypothetical protein